MSAIAASQVFASIRVVGGLLPADMLARIADGKDISGSSPADYHVVGARSVQDDAERHWDYLKGAWRALRDRPRRAERPTDPAGLAPRTGCCRCSTSTASAACSRCPPGSAPSDGRSFPSPPVGARPDPPRRLGHRPGPAARQAAACRRSPCSRSASTGPRRTCGGSCPTAGTCASCATRPPWSAAPTSTSTWRPSSTASCSREFVVLYRLLHVSRFEIPDGAAPSACRMERWRTEAIESRRPRPRPAPRRRAERHRPPRHRVPAPPRQHPAPRRPRRRTCSSAPCSGWSTGCFLFVAEDRDVLLAPGATRSQEPYENTSPPGGCATSRCAGGRDPQRPLAGRHARPRRPRRRERPARARPARPRRHLRRHRTTDSDPMHGPGTAPTSTCSPRSAPWPRPRPGTAAVPARRLPQPGRRGTRLHLRVPAGTGPEWSKEDAGSSST